jgi:hypothetical protein
MHACMYVCMYVRTYVRMLVCYVCIFVVQIDSILRCTNVPKLHACMSMYTSTYTNACTHSKLIYAIEQSAKIQTPRSKHTHTHIYRSAMPSA